MADQVQTPGYDDLRDLIAEVRRQGIYAGPDQIIAASDVIVRFSELDEEGVSSLALKTALGAVFCKTPGEQQTFYALYEPWAQRLDGAGTPREAARSKTPDAKPSIAPNPVPYFVVAVFFVAAIFAGSYWIYTQNQPEGLGRNEGSLGNVIEERVIDNPLTQTGASSSAPEAPAQQPTAQAEQSHTDTPAAVTPGPATPEPATQSEVAVRPSTSDCEKDPGKPGCGEPAGPVSDKDNSGIGDDILAAISLPELEQAVEAVDLAEPQMVDIAPPDDMSWWDVYSVYFKSFRNAATTAPLIAFVLWFLWRWRSKQSWMERRSEARVPQLWSLRIKRPKDALFGSRDYTRAIQLLRRHHRRPTRNLDVERTMLDTVRRVGLFSPVYETRQTSPEYLVLADRSTLSDHQAHIVRELVQQSKSEQMFVDLYYFDGDPRVCYSEKGRLDCITLDELASRHAAQRLLVATDGTALFDPIRGVPRAWTDSFKAWNERALIVPQSGDQWGERQRALHGAGFGVIPLDETGLLSLAEAFEEAGTASGEFVPPYLRPQVSPNSAYPSLLTDEDETWIDPEPVDSAELEEMISELRAYLGERGFALLAACASFPQPHWDVTLYLDRELHGVENPGGRERRLVMLAQLPWFRRGQMPDYLRLRLLSELPPERAERVRTALQDLLASAIDAPPGAGEIEVARSQPGDLKSALSNFFDFESGKGGEALHDHIFVRQVLGGRPGPLDVELPKILQKILPWKNWTAFTASVAARGVAGVIAAALVLGGFTVFEGPLRGVHLVRPMHEASLDGVLTSGEPTALIQTLDFSPSENRFVAVTTENELVLGHIKNDTIRLSSVAGLAAKRAVFIEGGREILVETPAGELQLHALIHLERGSTGQSRPVGTRDVYAVSPGRTHIVSAQADEVVYSRLGHRLAEQPAFTHPERVTAVAMDGKGETISAASLNYITVFTLASGQSTTYRFTATHLEHIDNARISRFWHISERRMLIRYTNGHVLSLDNGAIAIVPHKADHTDADFMSSGLWRHDEGQYPILYGSGVQDVIAWGPGESGGELFEQPLAMHALRGHEGEVLSAIVDRHGHHAISTAADGTARIWNMAERDEVAVMRASAGPLALSAVAPDNQMLLTVSHEGTFHLWDLTGVLPARTVPDVSPFDYDPIVIAVAAPLNGDNRELGAALTASIRNAVQRLNAFTGVLGRRVDVVAADDTCTVTEVADGLASKGAAFVIGHLCTQHSRDVSQRYAEHGIVHMSLAPEVGDAGDTTFFITEKFADREGEIAGAMLAHRFSDLAIAILHDGSARGTGLAEQARHALNRADVREALVLEMGDGDTAYSDAVVELRAAGVDVIYYAGPAAKAALLMGIAHAEDYSPQLVASQALSAGAFRAVSAEAGNGALMSMPRPVEVGTDWRLDPHRLYSAVVAWAEAVESAGSLDVQAVSSALGPRLRFDHQTAPNFPDFQHPQDAEEPYRWHVWADGEHLPQISGSQAVIVGAARYLDHREMLEANADAANMVDFARDHMGFAPENITVLADRQASYATIMSTLDGLVASTGRSDRVLVYFSTHGSQLADEDGDEADGLDETIVVYDSIMDGTGANHIRDDELAAALDRLVGRDVTVIIDTSHTLSERVDGYNTLTRRGEPSFIPAAADRRVWSSVAPLQTAFVGITEGATQASSIFTNFFIEGAAGRLADRNADGIVTNAELFAYVRSASAGWCAKEPNCDTALSPVLEIAQEELGHVIVPANAQVPAHLSREPRAVRTFALIVGISAYEHLEDIAGAATDAREIRDGLGAIGVPDANMTLLLNESATREAIVAAWRNMVARARPGDVIVISYAGHAGRFPERIKGSETDARDEALLLGGYSAGAPALQHRLLDDELHHLLVSAPQLRTIFIADTSHAGTLIDRGGDGALEHVFYFGAVGDAQTAAPVVLENTTHGALSLALTEALASTGDPNGDRFIDTYELQQAVRTAVLRLTGGRQIPVVRPNGRDRDHILRLERRLDMVAVEDPMRLHVLTSPATHDPTSTLQNVEITSIDEAELIWDARAGEMIEGERSVATLGADATTATVQGYLNGRILTRRIRDLQRDRGLSVRVEPQQDQYAPGQNIEIVIDGNDNANLVMFHMSRGGAIDVLVPGTQADDVSMNGTVTPNRRISVPLDWPASAGGGRLIAVTSKTHVTPLIRALRSPDRNSSFVRIFNTLIPQLGEPETQVAMQTIATRQSVGGEKAAETVTAHRDLVFQRGHSAQVSSVAISPDEHHLASVDAAGALKIWDIASRSLLSDRDTGLTRVNTVAFSPDGRFVFTAGTSGTVRMWNSNGGTFIRQFTGPEDSIQAIALSGDGALLLAGSADGEAYVWNVETSERTMTLKGHTDWIRSVAFSPDGRFAATAGDDNLIRLWELETEREVRQFRGHENWVLAVAFSPDGTQIASGGADNTVRVWNAETGAQLHLFDVYEDWVRSLAFSPDGRFILTGDDTNRLRRIDLESTTVDGFGDTQHEGWVLSVAISQSGALAATGSVDRTVRVWRAPAGDEVAAFAANTASVSAVAYAPDGHTVASAMNDGTIKVWDVATGRLRSTAIVDAGTQIASLAYLPQGRLLLAAGDNRIALWDLESGALVRSFGESENKFLSLAVAADGATFVSGAADGLVQLWDLASGEQRYAFAGHTDWVRDVVLTRDGRYALSASDDRIVLQWNIETGAQEPVKRFEQHEDWVRSIAISPDGRLMASGGDDQKVVIWDIASGDPVRTIESATGNLIGLHFAPDGTTLTGGNGTTVETWNTGTGERVLVHASSAGNLSSLALSPDGRSLVTAGAEGLTFWRTDLPAPLAHMVAVGGSDYLQHFADGTWTGTAGAIENAVIWLEEGVRAAKPVTDHPSYAGPATDIVLNLRGTQ